jgi:hypothetical protein
MDSPSITTVREDDVDNKRALKAVLTQGLTQAYLLYQWGNSSALIMVTQPFVYYCNLQGMPAPQKLKDSMLSSLNLPPQNFRDVAMDRVKSDIELTEQRALPNFREERDLDAAIKALTELKEKTMAAQPKPSAFQQLFHKKRTTSPTNPTPPRRPRNP